MINPLPIQFIRTISDIPRNERYPIAKEEHRGKASRVWLGNGKRTIMCILPCGHTSLLEGWQISGLEHDKPSAKPSIFCHGTDGKDCWHGYLTEGEFVQ